MSNSARILNLRQQAIEKLRESTMLFEQAYEVLAAGKPAEAGKLRDVARSKRAASARIMAEAAKLVEDSTPPSKPK